METKYLKINSADNVAVAITALPAGENLIVDGKDLILNEDIPAGLFQRRRPALGQPAL